MTFTGSPVASANYRPEIDGLRAFAVIPVILFHMGAEWMPGGYAGVDVFFVISGFLITQLILSQMSQGVFSLRDFWSRRIRRILPALVMMLLLVSMASYLIQYSIDINRAGDQGIAALLSMANFYYFIRAGNYWGPSAESEVFLHTWSLSVEEQFYLFWPPLIFILTKYCRKYLVVLVAGMVFASLKLFLNGSQMFPTITFYMFPTRAWELGSGCLLAVIYSDRQTRKTPASITTSGTIFDISFALIMRNILSLVGFILILLSYLLMSGDSGMSSGLVVPVLGTILVIAFSNDGDSIAAKLLTRPTVVYLGKISFSLYLWHWPVIVLSQEFPDWNLSQNPLAILLTTFVLSVTSYHGVEQFTRYRKNVILFIFLGFATSMLFSVFLSNYDKSSSIYNKTSWKGRLYSSAPKEEYSWRVAKIWKGIDVPLPLEFKSDTYENGGVIKQHGAATPEVVVLGDSHALMWSAVLDEILLEAGHTVSFYAIDSTPAFFDIPVRKSHGTHYFNADQKLLYDKKRLEYLIEWNPKVVVISARWSRISSIESTKDLIGLLKSIEAKVILIEQPPEIFKIPRNVPKYLSHLGMSPTGFRQYIDHPTSQAYDKGIELIREIASSCRHCEILPTSDLFLKNGKVWVLDNKDVLYIDSNHLSYQGALRVKPRLEKSLRALLD